MHFLQVYKKHKNIPVQTSYKIEFQLAIMKQAIFNVRTALDSSK